MELTLKKIVDRPVPAIFVWLLFNFLLMQASPARAASVSYNSGSNSISVTDSNTVCSISTLYSELVSIYGETYVKANVLEEISPKVWLSKAEINVLNPGGFLISDADVTELRVGKGGQNNSWALNGYIALKNVRLISWDVTSDCPSNYSTTINAQFDQFGGRCTLYSEAHDVEFYNFYGVFFGYEYGHSIDGLSYTNLTLNHTTKGLCFQKATHISVDNVLIQDGNPMFGGGIMSSQMDNSTISNVRVLNASDKNLEATGAYGLDLSGSNNTVHDYYIEWIAYSAVLLGGSHLNAYNMTVIDSGHNGFEINAGLTDATFSNITVKNSRCHNFFQVGRTETGETTGNITYENLRSETPGSYAITIGEGSYNTLVKNSTFLGKVAGAWDSKNVTFLNVGVDGLNSVNNDAYGFKTYIYTAEPYWDVFRYNENHKIIDCKIQNVYYKDIGLIDTKNVRIINQASTDILVSNSDYTKYDYVDVVVLDSTNHPVANAKVTFTNETNSAFSSVDGWGNDKSEFITRADGHVPLPNADRANSPAIAMQHARSNTPTVYFTHQIMAEACGVFASVSGIKPDSTWYRSDPNIPAQTITIVLPLELAVLEKAGVHPYPNPYTRDKNTYGRITFRNVPPGATIRIYNAQGNLIRTLSGTSAMVPWDVQNVASGVYVYFITSPEGKKKGKLSIIK